MVDTTKVGTAAGVGTGVILLWRMMGHQAERTLHALLRNVTVDGTPLNASERKQIIRSLTQEEWTRHTAVHQAIRDAIRKVRPQARVIDGLDVDGLEVVLQWRQMCIDRRARVINRVVGAGRTSANAVVEAGRFLARNWRYIGSVVGIGAVAYYLWTLQQQVKEAKEALEEMKKEMGANRVEKEIKAYEDHVSDVTTRISRYEKKYGVMLSDEQRGTLLYYVEEAKKNFPPATIEKIIEAYVVLVSKGFSAETIHKFLFSGTEGRKGVLGSTVVEAERALVAVITGKK